MTNASRNASALRLERRRSSQPPIRMLHIITRMIRGGADENTLATVKGLDKRRYHVDLVVGEGSELDLLDGLENVTVHVMPQLVRDPNPIKDVKALFKLARLIRSDLTMNSDRVPYRAPVDTLLNEVRLALGADAQPETLQLCITVEHLPCACKFQGIGLACGQMKNRHFKFSRRIVGGRLQAASYQLRTILAITRASDIKIARLSCLLIFDRNDHKGLLIRRSLVRAQVEEPKVRHERSTQSVGL